MMKKKKNNNNTKQKECKEYRPAPFMFKQCCFLKSITERMKKTENKGILIH